MYAVHTRESHSRATLWSTQSETRAQEEKTLTVVVSRMSTDQAPFSNPSPDPSISCCQPGQNSVV